MDSWTLISQCGLLVVDSKLWTLIFGLLVWTQDFGRLWTVDSWMWIVDCELCFLISQLWNLYSAVQNFQSRQSCRYLFSFLPFVWLSTILCYFSKLFVLRSMWALVRCGQSGTSHVSSVERNSRPRNPWLLISHSTAPWSSKWTQQTNVLHVTRVIVLWVKDTGLSLVYVFCIFVHDAGVENMLLNVLFE